MGKLICFNFEKNLFFFVFVLFLFSHEDIVKKLKKVDGGGNRGFREAIVDILLVQSGFQYYSCSVKIS